MNSRLLITGASSGMGMDFAKIFAEKVQMTNTRLFSKMINSRKIAMIGYNALMKGRRVLVPGFSNKLMSSSYRFTPRSFLLDNGKYIMAKV